MATKGQRFAPAGYCRIRDLARMAGRPVGQIYYMYLKGAIPAPSHTIGHYEAKMYTEAEAAEIVKTLTVSN